MSRRPRLTEKEKGKIDLLTSEKRSTREIGKKIKRSHTVVANYLKLKDNYGLKGNCGRVSKLTPLTKKRIIHLASKELMSANMIKHELQLPESKRTITRVLSICPTLIYKKFKSRPMLTARHKAAILEFASRSIKNCVDWSKIVWSDRRKFNLDGPDGLRCYWHDLRTDPKNFSKRQFGGGSVMIWGAFVSNTIFAIHIMEGNYNSEKYTDMLEECLDPFMQPDWVFMHDGASIHRSNHTKEWLGDKKIPILEWPANSPDLNPIENLWGLLARAVFANGRQFKTKDELTKEILKQWALMDAEHLISLVESLPNRIIDVISCKGSNTKY